jgi:single-strand DNA-binding protein
MLNRVQIIGNLGADPDIRSAQSGMRIANFRVAATERWKDQSGEQKERTEWISVAVMNDVLVGVAEKYLKKGSQVYVEGQMQTRKWTDSAGVEKYTTEVIVGKMNSRLVAMNPPGRDGGGGAGGGSDDRGPSRQTSRPAPARRSAPDDSRYDDDAEIPF